MGHELPNLRQSLFLCTISLELLDEWPLFMGLDECLVRWGGGGGGGVLFSLKSQF